MSRRTYYVFYEGEAKGLQITSQLTADTQTIQLGTSEKAGLFISSISYFLAAFTVGFMLNARLTGILFAAVIPPMAIVICLGTHTVSKFSRRAGEWTEAATSVAETAIRSIVDVQAFGVSELLAKEHLDTLIKATKCGVEKSIAGAALTGCVFFIACVTIFLISVLY